MTSEYELPAPDAYGENQGEDITPQDYMARFPQLGHPRLPHRASPPFPVQPIPLCHGAEY
ncbi:MAG: hypothetical protein MZV70_03330 [Desulfobacterales bacterium]|nr:hypothetical protein [Desulfobacterales bacterium]